MTDVKRNLGPVILNDYKVWPVYDALCFAVIPRHVQPIVTGVVGVGWCSYLSYVTHTDTAQEQAGSTMT